MNKQGIAGQLVERIASQHKNAPLLINISGCMGAGKSTWAELVSETFRNSGAIVTHVSEDDFLQPRAYREDLKQKFYSNGEWKGKSYWQNHENWLRLELMKQVITNLRNNLASSYRPYQRTTGALSETLKQVEPSDVVVFETSIFNELFDVVVLIDVDPETLLKKKLARDSDLRSADEIRQYHNVQLAFWTKYKPEDPDYIIDNNDHQNPSLSAKADNSL